MAVVHYKFKNSNDYDSLTFDGLAVSLRDLKQGILRKKKMKAEDTDLQVINAQTGEEYSSPSIMIPKNTSLVIARIPVGGSSRKTEDLTPQTKAKKWAAFRKETQAAIMVAEGGTPNSEKLKQAAEASSAHSTELEKITQIIKQSTKDFDPANYKYKVPTGVPSASYTCYKCGKGGHYIQNCPNENTEGASNSPSEHIARVKRPTGIPMEHMLVVNEPLPGTYQTASGMYAVPKIDAEAYATGKKEAPPFLPQPDRKPLMKHKPVPKELKCPLCNDIAKDAVVIPCCGISYCDDCIRNKLLESDDHVCPSCESMDVSPDGLIANQMLRRAVTNFQNETGYAKVDVKLAQAKVVEAARAAAAAGAVLQKQAAVVPRGPSVFDYKPPPRSASPPGLKVAPVQAAAPVSSSSIHVTPTKTSTAIPEPPTPTLDEPAHGHSYLPQQPPASTHHTLHGQGDHVPTVVNGIPAQPVRTVASSGGYNYFKGSPADLTVPPPALPTFPPHPGFPPPMMNPYAPPPIVVPPPVVVPSYPPPVRPTLLPPPLNLPKPLSEHEFLEEKKRLLREEQSDPLLEFAKSLEKRGEKKVYSRSRSRTPRSRTRSLSPVRYRSRSRSWDRRSPRRRSYTPLRRSLTPRRSYTPVRSRYSPRRTRSRSRGYSPKRYYSPPRSRSRSRFRSYSRSPIRRRSFSRSRSRDRRRSPLRRSPSPRGRARSPLRSYANDRYSARPLSPRPRSPRPRSPIRGRSPVGTGFQRSRSPVRLSPIRRRPSPLPRPQDKLVNDVRKKPSSPGRKIKNAPPKQGKKTAGSKIKPAVEKDKPVSVKNPNLEDVSESEESPDKVEKQKGLVKTNKENNPQGNLFKPDNRRKNNISIVLVDTSNDEETQINVRDSKALEKDLNTDKTNTDNVKTNTDNVKTNTDKANTSKMNTNKAKEDVKGEIPKTKAENKSNNSQDKSQASKLEEGVVKEENKATNEEASMTKNKKITLKLKDQKEVPAKETKKKILEVGKKDKEIDVKNNDKPNKDSSKENNASENDLKAKDAKTETMSSSTVEKSAAVNKPSKTRKKKPTEQRKAKSRSRSDSGSPPRFKEPLRLENVRPFAGGRGMDWDRRDNWDRRRERDFRGRGRGDYWDRGNFRPPGPDFRGGPPPPPFGDFRGDFMGAPPPISPVHPPDYRIGFGYPPDPHGYPGPYPPSGYPPPPAPVRDPREDPNYHGLNIDEDIVKFEQYKQMYDLYNRSYGFAPSTSMPGGHTPPQGPPPAPPGTMPLSTPPERVRAGSPLGRKSPSRRRSPPREKDRRNYDRDQDRRGSDRRRDERASKSPDRRRDERASKSPDRRRDERASKSPDRRRDEQASKSPDKKRARAQDKKRQEDRQAEDSPSPDRKRETQSEDEKETSPETKKVFEKEKKKDKKAKKKREKSENAEKKKKKKKDKIKSKKEKNDKKSKKAKSSDSSDDESDEPVKKKSKKHKAEESEHSDMDTQKKSETSRLDSTAQSELSENEISDNEQDVVSRKTTDTDNTNVQPEQIEQETVVSSSDNVKPEIEEVINTNKTDAESDSEVSQSDATQEPGNKRRSIKRTIEDADKETVESKKVKLETDETTVNAKAEIQPMDVSYHKSPDSAEDDIPAPEHELMLDPPELSKWETEDDPYELSPEPTRVKPKWKPEKQTFLPRSVIEKAEHAISAKVMKPTQLNSAVSIPVMAVKKEVKQDILEIETGSKKIEKSPKKTEKLIESKRRVFMDKAETRKVEERRVSSKTHNVQITVSGNDKRKVATESSRNSGGDLRDKLRDKREKAENISKDEDRRDRKDSRDYDRRDDRRAREKERERDDSSTVNKRRDSRKDSRDYDRQDSKGSSKKVSRHESVVDESKFVPDYNDESLSVEESSDSSTDSSSGEEQVKKKHKHKKTKHKKEKKAKKKKDKKKKKNKESKRNK